MADWFVDSIRLHRDRKSKTAWIHRGGGRASMPRKPAGLGEIRKAYNERRDERGHAGIAAKEAVSRSIARSSSEVDHDSCNGQPRLLNPQASTPRRYKSLGAGLLNKTLRSSSTIEIPRLSNHHVVVPNIANQPSSTASDFGASSENYGALPSSYRRVRKAKSMLTTRHHPRSSQGGPNLSPFTQVRTLRSVTSSVARPSDPIHIRLRRSLPFLRSKSASTIHQRANSGSEGHEEAVQIARAQFLEDLEHQRMQGPPSSPTAKMKTQRMPFRTSVRTSQVPEADSCPTSEQSTSQSPQACPARRSFSASLRDKLRKAVGKSVKGRNGIPPQQLEAQHSHFRALEGDGEDSLRAFDAYLKGDESQGTRRSVYFPSDPGHDTLEALDKISPTLQSAASRESLHSNGRSRVTSWTNSSMTSSIGVRSGQIERNRLSIIKEDGGPHQPSSSAGRHIGGVQVFHEPLQSITNDGRALPTVDSQRVYSALIKRINDEGTETERTRLALEAISHSHGNASRDPPDAKLTVRAVHSDSSLATMNKDTKQRQRSDRSSSWQLNEADQASEIHEENGEKNKRQHTIRESQSSFFPFSDEQNPGVPSPFKRFLNERRNGGRSKSGGESSRATSSVVIHRRPSNSIMNRPRFGGSSDSIYSRTTNGGVNEQYTSPVGSSEDLRTAINVGFETIGMATVMPTVYVDSNEGLSRIVDHSNRLKTQSSQWNPWFDTLTQPRQEEVSKTSTHTRENAQLDSDDYSKDSDQEAFGAPSQSEGIVGIRRRYPLSDLKIDSWGATPQPAKTENAGKRQVELLKSTGADGLSSVSNKVDHCIKASGSLRKLSPANLSKILREKKSQVLSKAQDTGKENSPTERYGSPPISTPRKLHLQFRNGTTSGRLRKRASETAFNFQKGVYPTPHSATMSSSTPPCHAVESPSEKAKDFLVARLSRPFNMDVPLQNRPFDSMYLGQRTPGHPDTVGDNRLSVAPKVSLDWSGSEVKETVRHTATETKTLPSGTSSMGRSASKVLEVFRSKRMVSNFLKSRREDKGTSESGQGLVGSSPAFI